jgi:hypothetical protein
LSVELQAWDAKDLMNAAETIGENYDVTARAAIEKINK